MTEHWGFRIGERILVPSLWGEQMGTVIDFQTLLGRSAGRLGHMVVYRLDDGRMASDSPDRLYRLNRGRALGTLQAA